MSEDSSSIYYQNNKARQVKKLVKYVKVVLRKRKKKCNNMVMNGTKIYQKTKNKQSGRIGPKKRST